MQFRVPQFIDIEDKVVGPLTLKQFGYILGAVGFSFLIWTFISIKIIAFVLIVLVCSLFLSLAFLKFNNRPFAEILQSAFSFYTGSKIYTWKQPQEKQVESSPINKNLAETEKVETIKKVSRDRLHDISLGLDVFDKKQNLENQTASEEKK